MAVSTAESTAMERSHSMLNRALNLHRLPRERQMFLILLLYMPLGVILTILRVCISLQALLYLLIIPNNFPLKRYFLRVLYGVLGIVVTTEDAGHFSDDTKVVVSNRVAWFDHMVWQAVMRCRTTSVEQNGHSAAPLSAILSHTHLRGQDDQALRREAEKLIPVEVTGRESPHQVTVIPLVVQPEPVPTNGEHCLLGFSSTDDKLRISLLPSSWAFGVTSTVQPVAVSSSRPLGFGVRVNTVTSGGWWDLFWTIFLPYTHFHFKFLPTITRKQKEPAEEFAKRGHQYMAGELGLQTCECGQEEVNAWIEEKRREALPVLPPNTGGVVQGEGDVPFIPINQYREVVEPLQQPRDMEMDDMTDQVSNVFPHLPRHIIQRDLRATQSVDATVLNIVEGRVHLDQSEDRPRPHARSTRAQRKQAAAGTVQVKQARHLPNMRGMTLAQKKQTMVETARHAECIRFFLPFSHVCRCRRYLARQAAKSHT